MTKIQVWNKLIGRRLITCHSTTLPEHMRIVAAHYPMWLLDQAIKEGKGNKFMTCYSLIKAAEDELFERKFLGKKRLKLNG